MKTLTIAAIFLCISLMFNQLLAAENENIAPVKQENVAIFFTLSQAEHEALLEEEKTEMDEVLSDYSHYQRNITPFLERNGIKTITTTEKPTHINKKVFESEVGIILVKQNKDPKIILGVTTDIDLMSIITDYYNLK